LTTADHCPWSAMIVAVAVSCACHAGDLFPIRMTADIYEQYDQVAESLQAWSERVIEQESLPLPVMELSEVVPDSLIESLPGQDNIRITLPVYLNVVSSSITLPRRGFNNREPSCMWSIPLEVSDGQIVLDGIPVTGAPTWLAKDARFLDYVRCRLATLRTVGFPRAWQVTCGGAEHLPVSVQLEGRHTTNYTFTGNGWVHALGKLSFGHLVYGALTEVESENENLHLHMFLLIKDLGGDRHHFLEWTEQASLQGGQYVVSAIRVRFLAYVRTDNLISLFAGQEAAPFPRDFIIRNNEK